MGIKSLTEFFYVLRHDNIKISFTLGGNYEKEEMLLNNHGYSYDAGNLKWMW